MTSTAHERAMETLKKNIMESRGYVKVEGGCFSNGWDMAVEAFTALESLSGGWQDIETIGEPRSPVLLCRFKDNSNRQVALHTPDNGVQMVGIADDYLIVQAYYADEDGWLDSFGVESIDISIFTHWQTLPLPPGVVPVTPAQLSEEEMVDLLKMYKGELMLRIHALQHGSGSDGAFMAVESMRDTLARIDRALLTIATVTRKP